MLADKAKSINSMFNFLIFFIMGTFKKGILGSFSGKVGNVVGASWRGISYMRSLPSSMRNPRTEKQLSQRNKFSLIGKFLKTILPVIRVGFKHIASAKNSAYSTAMSYNMQNALKGVYPDLEVDFEKVAIAQGGLYPANNVEAACDAGKLQFSWDETLQNDTSSEDRIMVAAYNPIKEEAAYDLSLGTRADGSGLLDLPATWVGDEVETFVAFASEDGSQVSDTVYTGKIAIVAAQP